jgi:opacity protein-like surface antigen
VRQDYYIAGVELGGTGALEPLNRFVNNGVILAPFGAYMFNDFVGVMGQMHVLAMPNRDACKPIGDPEYDPNGCSGNKPLEDDWTWALGATVGPRLALPLGGIEVWGTFQGGGFTGLSPNSPITHSSVAFSTGGGVNIAVNNSISLGGFARYNRLYQEAHDRGDVRYATGGISLTYKFSPLEAVPPSK